MRLAAALCAGLALPAAAADDLPFPPTEFSLFMTWWPVAAEIDRRCDGIEMDGAAYVEIYDDAVARLVALGVEPSRWRTETKGVPVGIADRPRVEFFFAFGITVESPHEAWCQAGDRLIGRDSLPGVLLRRVE